MIKISKEKVDSALIWYAENVYPKLFNHVKKHKKELNNYYLNRAKDKLGNFLCDEENLEKLILCTDLKELERFHEKNFRKLIEREKRKYLEALKKVKKISVKKTLKNEFKDLIETVFFFEKHSKWDVYKFTSILDTNTCPYCNRSYITTLGDKKEKLFRPDVDHFILKSTHPFLRMSFYNLVPSCILCNRYAKKDKPMLSNTHFHPYIDMPNSNARFKIEPFNIIDGVVKDFNIKFDTPIGSKEEANKEVFKLEKQYSNHIDEVENIFKKETLFNKESFKKMTVENDFKEVFEDSLDYNNAFDNLFYNTDDLDENKLLSKFRKDIIYQIREEI